MGFLNEVGTIRSFERKEYEMFYWEIGDLSTRLKNVAVNDYYGSPDFNETRHFKEGDRHSLRFYPNGARNIPGFIGLGFRSSRGESSCVYLTLGLKTRSGRIEKLFNRYISFPQKNEIDPSALIRRSEILRRKEELVPSDVLTFVVILSTNPVEVNRGIDKVAEDMGKLLASGNRSDATVLVGQTEFQVHSCILTARTPVFAALFEHDTIEKQTRKITITDCEPDIFKEFLNYIYTGSVQNLTTENSSDLYRIADKYLVKDLKEVCREYIQNCLCLESFCEAVRLALMIKDEDLLENTFNYFAKNFRVIIRSVEWQRYIEENPREANEIFIRSLGPP